MGILPRGDTSDRTYTASGDLSDSQFHIAKLSAAETVAICGAGEKCQGVLKNAPEDGGQASLVTRGETLVYVDATVAINAGDRIKSAAAGVGVKVEADDEGGTEYLGTAMEGKASGTGTIVVDVQPGMFAVPDTTA